MRARRVVVTLATLAAFAGLGALRGEAHKPITSPFTFNDDVYPILRERCGRCHVSGGAGPMSLMTHKDTVPWSESIRIELMAGHMPPWGLEGPAERFRHAQSLTARELNVIMTWASGGTPIGNSENPPAAVELERGWRLGPPDLVVPLPEFAMSADTQDDVVELTLVTDTTEPRWLRAVDLQPGTPAIVRDARIALTSAASDNAHEGSVPERVLALWVPGDDVVDVGGSAAFRLPARAELLVRVHYKKTWEYERRAMTDRSSIGLYFAPGSPRMVRALTLRAPATAQYVASGSSRTVSFERLIDEDVHALAMYPDPALVDVRARIDAIRPNGSREQLISLRARKDWARRHWFSQPVELTRGTRISVHAVFDAPPQAIAAGPAPALPDPSTIRFTLDVVPAR